ncbi:MAG: type II secretion system major pseudopilin GspG [Gammaproteobacteria bacterium]|nr:type II secretion system major pseudopilin GspG [Gammaproteobacteria bacterium]
MKSNLRGFTLVELLVVLIILGLVASIAGPNVMKYLGSSKAKTAKLQLKEIESSLELFFLDTGKYPSNSVGLKMLISNEDNISGWNGPYFKTAELPDDPWGNPYVYRIPGERGAFDLLSLGADNQPGGDGDDADISNWKN